MSDDDPEPADAAVTDQLERWRDAVGAPGARGAWRGPAKYVAAALLLLLVVPLAVRYLVSSPLIEAVGGHGLIAAVIALPLVVIYGVFRILR